MTNITATTHTKDSRSKARPSSEKNGYSMYTQLRECAQKYRRAPALIFGAKKLSFCALLKKTDAFAANLLQSSAKQGDVVTIVLHNSPAAAIALYAACKVGTPALVLPHSITASQLKQAMAQADSQVLITSAEYSAKNASHLDKISTITCHAKLAGGEPVKGIERKQTKSFQKMLRKTKQAAPVYKWRTDEPAILLAKTGENKTIKYSTQSFCTAATAAKEIILTSQNDYNSKDSKAKNNKKSKNNEYNKHGKHDKNNKHDKHGCKVAMSALPLFDRFGISVCLHLFVCAGVANVMEHGIDTSRQSRAIIKYKIATIVGLAAQFLGLLSDKELQKADLSSLSRCFSCDQTPQPLIEDFTRFLKKHGSDSQLYTLYGVPETADICAASSKHSTRANSVGIAQKKSAIIKNNKILENGEIGEIAFRADFAALGYLGGGTCALKALGGEVWLLSGDYGYKDDDGYLYYCESIRNTIKVSGIPVFPSEIEQLMQKISGIKRVAAVGVKDLERGEVVKLLVEAELGADQTQLKKQIQAAAATHLTPYATPRKIEFRQKLPLTAIGKVDKQKLIDN